MENAIQLKHEHQARLEAAKAAFFNSGGQITQARGFAFKPLFPARSDKIDPDTVLKRRRISPTMAERKILRRLAEEL